MTNRAVRGLELFAQYERVNEATLLSIKHDNRYSSNYRGMTFLKTVLALQLEDSQLREAQEDNPTLGPSHRYKQSLHHWVFAYCAPSGCLRVAAPHCQIPRPPCLIV